MFRKKLQVSRSAISSRLRKFSLALKASEIFLSRADQLVFLCGANQQPGVPSARRAAAKRFIEQFKYRVVYAEAVFGELAGDSKNVLDLEHEITAIADKIVIILESESAFCELGAFTHQDLRKKLVVINDSRFRKSDSFINAGPIAALNEVKAPVLWYPMGEGTRTLDGIGATFSELKTALFDQPPGGSVRIKDDLKSLPLSKSSLYFVHDLVLFAGPVTHGELIMMLKTMFEDQKSFDRLKRLLGILKAANMIVARELPESKIYQSVARQPYLKYSIDASALMAAFRVHHMAATPERFFYA